MIHRQDLRGTEKASHVNVCLWTAPHTAHAESIHGGILALKKLILLSFPHPHVILNQYIRLSSLEHKKKII